MRAFLHLPAVKPLVLLDRLGGDTWNAGFYFGLLTESLSREGLSKCVLVGDAATHLKQTIIFDRPMIDKADVQSLMKSDRRSGGKRTPR